MLLTQGSVRWVLAGEVRDCLRAGAFYLVCRPVQLPNGKEPQNNGNRNEELADDREEGDAIATGGSRFFHMFTHSLSPPVRIEGIGPGLLPALRVPLQFSTPSPIRSVPHNADS